MCSIIQCSAVNCHAWQLVWCVIVTSCDCQLDFNKGLLWLLLNKSNHKLKSQDCDFETLLSGIQYTVHGYNADWKKCRKSNWYRDIFENPIPKTDSDNKNRHQRSYTDSVRLIRRIDESNEFLKDVLDFYVCLCGFSSRSINARLMNWNCVCLVGILVDTVYCNTYIHTKCSIKHWENNRQEETVKSICTRLCLRTLITSSAHHRPQFVIWKNTDGWKKNRLIFGLAEWSRKLKDSGKTTECVWHYMEHFRRW